MKESKKAILNILKDGHKDRKFDSLVLNLALQKIDSDDFEYDGRAVYTSDKGILVYCLTNDDQFTVPEGVKVIGQMAFQDKKQLKQVTIASTVEKIGRDAFYDCDDLESVIIPAGVETLNAYCFAECDKLKEVRFMGVPKHLSSHCFDDSDDLHNIIVPLGTVKAFRKALHITEGDPDFVVVEDENVPGPAKKNKGKEKATGKDDKNKGGKKDKDTKKEDQKADKCVEPKKASKETSKKKTAKKREEGNDQKKITVD